MGEEVAGSADGIGSFRRAMIQRIPGLETAVAVGQLDITGPDHV
jgi:hypothetical protein